MALHYRASISQTTGEDWADVDNLTLSTAAPHYMTSIPSLGPLKIKPAIPSVPPPPLQSAAISPFPTFRTGGLFGQPQQQPAFGQTTGFGAFGGGGPAAFGSAAPPSNNTTTSTSLFGSAAPAANTNTSTTGASLFGAAAVSDLPIPTTIPDVIQPAAPTQSTETKAPSPFSFGTSKGNAISGNIFGSSVPSLPAFGTTTTAVSDSGISATFQVKGKATIPSDKLSHNVAIAALQVESEISYITVPKISPVAYLQVSFCPQNPIYLTIETFW